MSGNNIEKSFSRTISQIVEVAEATFGTEQGSKSKWEFFRTVLLKRLNGLKREVLETAQEREGQDYGNYKREL
jgi:hypothetical protein